MKLILHPGHSKCGSTTIQKAIIKNRTLLENHGYVIPDPQLRTPGDSGFNPNGETSRPFFRHVMEKENIGPLKYRLDLIKEKYENSQKSIIISAENLVNQLGKPSGFNIHRELVNYFSDIDVVYYIKRQDNFIMSAWQQWGYKEGLSLEKFVARSIRMRNPNYFSILKIFSELYGNKNIKVAPLEGKFLYKNNLVSDFFYHLGVIENIEVPDRGVENKSLNPYVCEALSEINYIFRDIHDESIKQKLEELIGEHPGLFMRVDEYFSKDLRKDVMKCFERDNIFLTRNFNIEYEWNDLEEDRLEYCNYAASQAAKALALGFSKLI